GGIKGDPSASEGESMDSNQKSPSLAEGDLGGGYEMLTEKERTARLIKPILRGRDIKRYGYEWANLWLINTHNGYEIPTCHSERSEESQAPTCHSERSEESRNSKRDSSLRATHFARNDNTDAQYDTIKIPPIDIKDYPALKTYFDEVAKTNKGKGKGFWERSDKGISPYNLRDCAYLLDFEKEKIVYPNMNKEFIATLDKSSFYTNQKCFIITSERENLAYLTGILNSKLNFWYFRQIGATLGANGYEMSKIFVEKLPIPKINPKNSKIAERIVNLVEQILALKAENSNQKSLASGLETADKSPSLAEGI
ncbi:hypothetical protein DMC01_13070, partial [Campylobacter troglodytis]